MAYGTIYELTCLVSFFATLTSFLLLLKLAVDFGALKSYLLCSSFGSTYKFCDNLWVGGSLELKADFDIVFFFRDLKYSSLSSVYSCT